MRFAVKFLGCKVSHADAMLARRRLLEAGHEEAPEGEAELHVINTCCITGEAEAKSRQSVRRSLKTAQAVYVGGCAVNLRAAQFAEIDQAVRPFTGTAEDVAQAMAGALGGCVDLEHEPLVGRARRGSPPCRARAREPRSARWMCIRRGRRSTRLEGRPWRHRSEPGDTRSARVPSAAPIGQRRRAPAAS